MGKSFSGKGDNNMEDSLAMSAGDGPNSYFLNSRFQESAIGQTKEILISSIRQCLPLPLDTSVVAPSTSRVFRIADLGCATGPNTFACVKTITQAIKSLYGENGLKEVIPEFQVYFNDQVGNDFNVLFRNLPLDRSYKVAAVPGSFYGRLFPEASVDLFHLSCSLQWLSKVPDEVTMPGSLAWNKGRIIYAESAPKVTEAYKAQFQRDLGAFFDARYVEMTENGMIVVLIPCRVEGIAPSETEHIEILNCVGHVLHDMTKEGLVEESLLDSFNFPLFFPMASEVMGAIQQVKGLRVDVIQVLQSRSVLSNTEVVAEYTTLGRGALWDILSNHFGSAQTAMLFERLPQKFAEDLIKSSPSSIFMEKSGILFMLIKKIVE